ncbi:major facilitator superfamily domain-containing protein [Ilyonectria destructans]|nr:major facilitator superfamily domain-containing protein [Ilyonectria destructans]
MRSIDHNPEPSTLAQEGVGIIQSISTPRINRWRLAASCLMNLTNGMNDAAPGALIPYMEKYYNIGYAIVSLIFVGNALGFILGALLLDVLHYKLGRARLLALSQSTLALAYVPILVQAPYPAIIISFLLIGFSISLNLAMGNIFCGQLRDSTTALGAISGAYGLGGTVGPLIATTIVTAGGASWSVYYFMTLGLALANDVFAPWSFRNYRHEMAFSTTPAKPSLSTQLLSLFSTLRRRVVLLGALFIFSYQGAEVSISGWVISFLIEARHGDPSSVGYVSAGFWAGITIGRLLLTPLAHRIGEKRFVYGTTMGAMVFQVLAWWIPNVVGSGVSISIIGLLLGPIYPCAVAVFMRGMPAQERVSGMGTISAFGSSGGAIAPFTTGLLAQAKGPWVLHPIAIALFMVMQGCWYGVPESPRRDE